MKKKICGLCLVIVVVIAGIWGGMLWRSGNLPFQRETIYIAVAGPMTGQYQAEGQRMLAGIRLYLEHLRQQGGLPGKHFELLLYDDQDDPQRAETAANQIIRDNKALFVLGHFNSSASIAAGAVYKKYEIPAITASATSEAVTRGNIWYFRVVPHNQIQAAFIANYIKHSLRKDEVGIVFIEDDYGRSLFTNFEYAAQKIGLRIVKRWNIPNAPAADQDAQLTPIITELGTLENPPQVIFLATYAQDAAKMITALRQTQQNYLWIGADDIASEAFLQAVNTQPNEQTASDKQSDGVYGTSPFLAEIAGEQGYEFVQDFERQHHRPPSWDEAYYYDAMQVAVEAIKRADLQGKGHLYNDRKKLRETLLQFYNEDTAIEGATGKIFFDEQGNVIRPYAIGCYQRQRFLPAPTQYYPIPEPEDRQSLFAKVQQGQIIVLNGRFMVKREIVYTGVKIHEICQLDVENSTYTVDFSVWFRFQEGAEVNDARITLQNTVSPVRLGQPVFDATENGMTTRIYRVKATFQDQFDFKAYPFDRHELRISFSHAELPLEKLGYVADYLEPPQVLRDPVEPAQPLCCQDNWKLADIVAFQNMKAKLTTFGLPKYFSKPLTVQYSQFNIVMPIERATLWWFILQALPTFVLIVCVFMFHFLPVRWFWLRMLISVSALLTNVYYHRLFAAEFATDYLTRFEYVILIAYGVIMLSMLLSFSEYSLYQKRLLAVQGIQLFAPLSDPLKVACSKKIQKHRFRKPGKTIFAQGQPNASIFVIMRGEVSLQKMHADGTAQEIARRGAGDCIGEDALFGEKIHAVSAVSAATPVVVGELTCADLIAALKKYPALLEQLKQHAEQTRLT